MSLPITPPWQHRLLSRWWIKALWRLIGCPPIKLKTPDTVSELYRLEGGGCVVRTVHTISGPKAGDDHQR